MSRTLAEAMAIEVLKGDMAAACALADRLLEERTGPSKAEQALATRNKSRPLGTEVYHWPEFRAFARRLGLVWDLLTIDVTITIPLEGAIRIDQSYQGVNMDGSQGLPPSSPGG